MLSAFEHRQREQENGGILCWPITSSFDQAENGNTVSSTNSGTRLSSAESNSSLYEPKYVDVRHLQVDTIPVIAVNGEVRLDKKNNLSVGLQEATQHETESGYNTEGSPLPDFLGFETALKTLNDIK